MFQRYLVPNLLCPPLKWPSFPGPERSWLETWDSTPVSSASWEGLARDPGMARKLNNNWKQKLFGLKVTNSYIYWFIDSSIHWSIESSSSRWCNIPITRWAPRLPGMAPPVKTPTSPVSWRNWTKRAQGGGDVWKRHPCAGVWVGCFGFSWFGWLDGWMVWLGATFGGLNVASSEESRAVEQMIFPVLLGILLCG